jgi:hypothetical protein
MILTQFNTYSSVKAIKLENDDGIGPLKPVPRILKVVSLVQNPIKSGIRPVSSTSIIQATSNSTKLANDKGIPPLSPELSMYICCSFVQLPISAGKEPEKLFELIPLQKIYIAIKNHQILSISRVKTCSNIDNEEAAKAYSNLKSVSKPISLGIGPDNALIPKVIHCIRVKFPIAGDSEPVR